MAYLRAERAKQFVYHNVSIYVQRPLSEEEEWAANNPDSEAAGTASTTSNGDTYKGFNKKARLEDEEGGGEYIGGRGGGRRRTASNSSTGDHHHARNGHDSDASAAAALSADVVLSSFNLRRSSRRRRGRNELELKVSSSDKLRDVKTRVRRSGHFHSISFVDINTSSSSPSLDHEPLQGAHLRSSAARAGPQAGDPLQQPHAGRPGD